MSLSRDAFLSKGVTSAFFISLGNNPSCKDLFTVVVMEGARVSRTVFKSHVGNGSKEEDFGGDFKMIFDISSTVTSLKELKPFTTCDGGRGKTVFE
jgi:hypothetical protein